MKIVCKLVGGGLIPYDEKEEQKLKSMGEGNYHIELNKYDKRSLTQNNSLWLWLTNIAHTLNNSGMYITDTVKTEVEWSKDSVKVLLFDPVVKALYNKTSSTQLNKDEYDKIIDTIIVIFANKGISVPEFPNRDKLK